ncbi:MAG TPA: NAD-dependent epimerase/dehydratase family protein [Phycisphaerae bacterium]|nr:NAD-dependent epimerase/dehydratase family protein [Phycisphaerae bacterium]HOQ85996.1 NAD-dependent epimerase/dehydratase family protein [Phycisphaerae bacterium]HPU27286.1 NAD-dependent epimerase/dehydratase family protein [Phycisphaerae bacterium]HPZ97101.1 NAD-dependent epimerase/dehydratase family protein [Phycisphaerae bacterium]HQE28386.1 NAD-dependent epimerase/dehydratase family protein [Phycisphaerae bacterium]
MSERQYNVGLAGTGYIAHYHAKALCRMPSVRLAAVCDLSRSRASDFAAAYGIAGVHTSLETMLARERLDVVHVLTPPPDHGRAGRLILDAGAHLLLEKPMCTDLAECDSLLHVAEQRGLRVGANHNFLFHPAYERLRGDVRSGLIGSLDHIAITWALELPQVKNGPFDMWALRDPANILLEVGSHAISQVLDLAPVPEEITVRPSDAVQLPGGVTFFRRWQISMLCGPTAVDVYFSFAPGFARRTVQASGLLGTALTDLERNTYVLQRHGRRQQDFGKYEILAGAGRSLQRQARGNLVRYLLSKAGLCESGNAYAASMTWSIRAFYRGLTGSLDARCSGQLGRQVVEQCIRMAAQADLPRPAARPRIKHGRSSRRADTLVLGGTGFIGRELVRQLLADGQTVRVLSRSRCTPLDADHDGLDIVTGDVRNPVDLTRAFDGVRDVYHLARSPGGSWKNYYEQDVLGTQKLAQLCGDVGIRRLVYTSSIVGYRLDGSGPITEDTPFDPAVCRQNKYARAKAQAEAVLMAAHRERALPVVIVRPGMVIGRGGDLCHGGVGTWNGLGSCTLWGDGRGKLPFVLVEDVARGLIAAMQTDGIEGESFNLVDDPLISAREYVEEIARFSGMQIQIFRAVIWQLYVADIAKWLAKIALRMPERYVPTYGMWKARVASAHFDNSKAKQRLGWAPAGDRETLLKRGIHVHLVERSAPTAPAGPVCSPESSRL